MQQMSDLLRFDTVEEIFSIAQNTVLDNDVDLVNTKTSNLALDAKLYLESQDSDDQPRELQQQTVADSFSEGEDDAEENSIIQQLKTRRMQLEQDLLKASPHSPHPNIRKARKDEKQERINELREQVVPGITPLVIDTNCFIGDLSNVKKVIQCAKWQIIIPLVGKCTFVSFFLALKTVFHLSPPPGTIVITELDGLRTNHSTLGTAATEALAYLEQIFSQNKSQATRLAHVRIQTSHNNFLHDISMRSEQFMWGETDRNLDDLILSVCLWWAGQTSTEAKAGAHRVCLVTSDRNLSVKARARDIRVADLNSLSRIAKK